MQLKVLLPVVAFALTASTLLAQQKGTLKNTPAVKSKADTVTTSVKYAQAGLPLLANNTSSVTNTSEKLGYGHVPLAGEKAYFGEMNDYVNDFVRRYMEQHSGTLSSVQNNSATPFSVIDNILEQKKMPKELKYLAVIESALNHNAVSRAGAVGPWQMMETTARMMGLAVNRKHDERTDWSKSTAAATKYLDLLYSQLNDWLLVVAAYNSGPTPVQRAIEKTGSHNFWEIKDQLPRETQGHVLAFIATASIFENLSKFISLGSIPVDFKFGNEKEEEPVVKETPAPVVVKSATPTTATAAKIAVAGAPPPVTAIPATVSTPAVKRPSFTDDELKNMSIIRIDQPVSFDLLALDLGIDKKLMMRWNADYDMYEMHKYPTTFYKLRLPKDKTDDFLKKRENLYQRSVKYYSQR